MLVPWQTTLPAPFTAWATPKLPALAHARLKDARLPPPGDANFDRCLRYYLAEFAKLSFSQGDFVSNVCEGSTVYVSPEDMRQRAEAFFRIGSYFCADNENGGEPLLELTGPGLWAASQDAHIRELTSLELGIPQMTETWNTYDQKLYAVIRRKVIAREFNMISKEKQAQWAKLAAARTAAMARGETAGIAVQDRQATINDWILETICEKLHNTHIGESMVINWDGYYVGGEDKSLRFFRGQVATHGPLLHWLDAPIFGEHVLPAWKSFMRDRARQLVSSGITELTREVRDDEIPRFRKDLRFFLEELFILQCGFNELDANTFWAKVKLAPYKFVAPERLPDCISFSDPLVMKETDFRAAYAHIWLCHVDRDAVRPESRFAYEPDIIEEYITMAKVGHLKAAWDKKKW